MTRSELLTKVRAYRAAREKACEALDDDTASGSCIPLYPTLTQDGSLIKYGTRIRFNDRLFKAALDIWDRPENDPAHAPTLWVEIIYSGGIREIPETISAAEAFSKGEKGRWKGVVYESSIDNNVWNPDQYPAGWKAV